MEAIALRVKSSGFIASWYHEVPRTTQVMGAHPIRPMRMGCPAVRSGGATPRWDPRRWARRLLRSKEGGAVSDALKELQQDLRAMASNLEAMGRNGPPY